MPALNMQFHDRVLQTFIEILQLKVGEELTIQLKDEVIVLRRMK